MATVTVFGSAIVLYTFLGLVRRFARVPVCGCAAFTCSCEGEGSTLCLCTCPLQPYRTVHAGLLTAICACPRSQVTGTADSYNQVKIFHDFAARPKQSPGLSPVTSGGTDTSSSPKSRAMTPVEVTMSSPTERQQDHNAEAQPPLTGVRLAAIDSLSPMPGQVGEEAAASD